MKNLKKLQLLSFILLIGFLIYSCQDTIEFEDIETKGTTEITETTETNTAEVIDFKGLPVKHRFSTPVEELFLEETIVEEFTAKYNRIRRTVYLKTHPNLSSKAAATVAIADEDLPTGAMIIEGVKMVVDQFPYDLELLEEEEEGGLELIPSPLVEKDSLTVEEYEALTNLQEQDSITLANYELAYQAEKEAKDEANMEMIKQDFPTLSEESIEENIDLIDEYYQKNLDYMALEEVVTHEEEIETSLRQSKLQSSQKTSTFDAGSAFAAIVADKKNLNELETCVYYKLTDRYGMIGGVITAYIANKAGEKARGRANSYYSGLHDKLSRLDAFRHAYWNALMCKNYVTSSKVKQRRTDFAAFIAEALYDCGDAYDTPSEAIDIDARAMDRHNDNVGRRIYARYSRVIKIWGWEFLKEPSYYKLRKTIKERIHKTSDYIVKEYPDENQTKYDYTKQEVVDKINQIKDNDDRPVYFRKTIAPPYYTYSRYGPWYKRRYRKITNYPTYHSKDPNLTYNDLSKETN